MFVSNQKNVTKNFVTLFFYLCQSKKFKRIMNYINPLLIMWTDAGLILKIYVLSRHGSFNCEKIYQQNYIFESYR